MTENSTYHEGELAVQRRAGSVSQGQNSGRMISDKIIPGAIKFVKKQPFLVLGSVDEQGDLWASIAVGETGFVSAEPRQLEIDLQRTIPITDDPLWKNLEHHSQVGILVIDLRSRARLRVNGSVVSHTDQKLQVAVNQAYPNCPQYIQRRNYRPASDTVSVPVPTAQEGTGLGDDQIEWINSADTLFVASAHPDHGVDASHRGGSPGFVKVIGPRRLQIPDYAGNGMFNTLGNFEVNPRAGLVFPDFEQGRTLQLTGRAEIQWDRNDSAKETGGTGRFWTFAIEKWIQIERALPGTTEFLDYSPNNP